MSALAPAGALMSGSAQETEGCGMADAIVKLKRWGAFVLRLVLLLALSFGLAARPAAAQSILRDAETEALFRDMSRPILEAAGLRPENVQVVLIHDRSINAFVAGGQIVYIHSGLLAAAGDANEVQGVIAHEVGHITGGHIIRIQEGIKVATGIMILSMVLGAAAMAAGAGEAGMGLLAAGQQAAMGKFLAFSRTQESAADAAGASYLAKSGTSGKGLISFFKKLQNQEFRYAIPQDDGYSRTHPLTGERMSALEQSVKNAPGWGSATDPKLEARFQRVKAKLSGFVEDPARTLVAYPVSNKSVPARYARAYAWHKSAYPDKALAEADSLLAEQPTDPYFLELKGQILLESGRPAEALESLRQSVRYAPDQPLIAALLGHALISTEKPDNFEEAKKVLRAAIGRDNSNPFAWYQLGIVYDREGDSGRAALATAERYNLQGEPRLALVNAEQALRTVPAGTPDWLRAQDIAMVSRTEVERKKKNRDN
jgi:predicted Zn-dependent protease